MISFYNKFSKYIKNISWMMAERVLTLLVGLLLSIYLAREIGPENYGMYSYGLSIVTILAVVAQFGLNGIVVRDIAKNINTSDVISHVILVKLIFSIVSLVILYIISIYITEPNESNMLLLFSGIIIFSFVDVFDYWFQSQVLYKYVMIARLISVIIGCLLKVLVVILGMNIFVLSFAHSLSLLTFSLIILYFFNRVKNFKLKFNYQKEMVSKYFKEGFQIFIGTFFSIVYLKVDQIMIKTELGTEAVGVYAVASQLSEAWYFIPVTIVISFFPTLVKQRENNKELYYKNFQYLLDSLFALALTVSFFVFIVSESFINFIYGSDYIESSMILQVHIFAGLFVFMRAAFSKWVIIEKEYFFSIFTQGLGAVTNIILNYYLIEKYGVIGAAYATLFSYMIASYLSLIFYKKTRVIFIMMTKSIFVFIRYPFNYILRKS